MGKKPDLIWCADGNQRHALFARDAGWLYGARLPHRGLAPLPLVFADQDWKKPNREKYMKCLAEHRPKLATVLDWEREEQRREVFSWAEEAALYAEAVLIIPKVPGTIGSIPRSIGGKPVRLAYSVPTRYGGSKVSLAEHAGWPVHLLGGSPQAQHKVWLELRKTADVLSMDGNMAKKMATSRCLYWTLEKTDKGHWQNIKRAVEYNAPDECVKRTCVNVMSAWDIWSRQ